MNKNIELYIDEKDLTFEKAVDLVIKLGNRYNSLFSGVPQSKHYKAEYKDIPEDEIRAITLIVAKLLGLKNLTEIENLLTTYFKNEEKREEINNIINRK